MLLMSAGSFSRIADATLNWLSLERSGATRRAAPSLRSSRLVRIASRLVLTYMCAPRTRGLALFKAFLLHRVDGRLQNYSTKNRSISGLC
jgi:hypothetical protein